MRRTAGPNIIALRILPGSGALDQAEALRGIDWNTIGTLAGLMISILICQVYVWLRYF